MSAGHRRAQPTPGTRWLLLGLVTLVVVAVDQATKAAVRGLLGADQAVHRVGPVSLDVLGNRGIAGGGLESRAVDLSLLATLSIVGILGYLAWKGVARTTVLVGFGLLLGGGLGNLLDRVRLGYVTDFILEGDRAFNLADVAIVLGSAIVFLGLVGLVPRAHPGQGKRRRAQPTRSGG